MDNLRRTLSAPAAFLALLVGWTLPLPRGRGMERVRGRDVRDSHHTAGSSWDGAAKTRTLPAQALVRGRNGFRPFHIAGGAAGHPPRASGVVDDRRHRAHLLSSIRQASAPARVGNRGSSASSASSSISADIIAGWPAESRSPGQPPSWSRLLGHRAWPVAAPFLIPLDALSGYRAMGESFARPGRRSNPLSDKDAQSAAAHRTEDLALLRNLRHRERSHACRRTTSRKTPRPVLAHRTSPTNLGLYLLSVVAACDFGWLGKLETAERTGGHAWDHERARAISRAFLQLV